MEISKLLTEHPTSVGETYAQHLAHAIGFGTRMVLAGVACILHGLLPFLFVRTGSRAVAQLHERMVINRRSVLISSAARLRGDPVHP
jgi:Family of unknown function (DUF6356)